MKNSPALTRPYLLLLFACLALASGLATAMVAYRWLHAGRLAFNFVVWNLFLAWLPFLLALLAARFADRWPLRLGFGAAWLLFLPNSLYLVTDLIHLRPQQHVPVWYDAILLFLAAVTGLFLGYASLYLMQSLVARLWGAAAGWLFAFASLALSAYGVYVGRFLRWNSWDVFVNPGRLLADLLASAADPELRFRTVAISVLFMVVFAFVYVILFTLPRITRDP